MNSFIIQNLIIESKYLRSNLNYLNSLTWSQHNSYKVSLSNLLDESKIRKFKKSEIIESFINLKTLELTPYSEKVKSILQSGAKNVMRKNPVYILKTTEGISILEGRHRIGAAFIENSNINNIDILDSTADLNCYLGEEVSI